MVSMLPSKDAFAFKGGIHAVLIKAVVNSLSPDSKVRKAIERNPDNFIIACWGSNGPDLPFNQFGVAIDFQPWADRFHYEKVGSFAEELFKLAFESGDDRKIAWAAGWITHVTGDMAAHGIFVNPDPEVGGPYFVVPDTKKMHQYLEAVAETYFYNPQGLIGKSYTPQNMQATFQNVIDDDIIALMDRACVNTYSMLPGAGRGDDGTGRMPDWINFYKLITLDTGIGGFFTPMYEILPTEVESCLSQGTAISGPQAGLNRRQRLEKAFESGKNHAVQLITAAEKGDYSAFSNEWNIDTAVDENRSIGTLTVRIKTAEDGNFGTSEYGTGTDDDIHFGLVLDSGEEWESPTLDIGGIKYDDFDNNEEDDYFLYVPRFKNGQGEKQSFPIERTKKFFIRKESDNALLGGAWKVEEITIWLNGKLYYRKKLNRWIDNSHGLKVYDNLTNYEQSIKDIYSELLGRMPSESELGSWMQQLEYGRDLNYIETWLKNNSMEYKYHIKGVINSVFGEILWRDPSDAELQKYFDLMTAGKASGSLGIIQPYTAEMLMADLKNTREYSDIASMKNEINSACQNILSRYMNKDDFDIGNNKYYLKLRRDTGNLTEVNKDLNYQLEITNIYKAGVGRMPGPQEMLNGLTVLRKGGTLEDVKWQLRNIPEYYKYQDLVYKNKTAITPGILNESKVIYSVEDLPLVLYEGTLDLNHNTLTVRGSLEINKGTTIKVNGGRLIVEGSISMNGGNIDAGSGEISAREIYQNSGKLDVNSGKVIISKDYIISGNIYINPYITSYTKGTGILKMTNPSDRVFVGGNFITTSEESSDGYLTDGVLELKGNLIQAMSETGYIIKWRDPEDGSVFVNDVKDMDAQTISMDNFKATGNCRIILSGDKMQKVYFASPAQEHSKFSNIEIDNTSAEGVVFESAVYVAGLFEHNSKKFTLLNPVASEFNDYDNDGLKDNIDPQPTVSQYLPQPVDIYPARDAAAIPKSAQIKIAFNVDILPVNLSAIEIKDNKGVKLAGVSAFIENDKRTLIINHSSFTDGKIYTVSIPQNTVKSIKSGEYNRQLGWKFTASYPLVKPAGTKLIDALSQTANGENGITVQYREAGSSFKAAGKGYQNLGFNGRDYTFSYGGKTYPVVILKKDKGIINVTPFKAGNYRYDTVISAALNDSYDEVQISGNVNQTNGERRFYIYLGENNFDVPIWQSTVNGSFNIRIKYNEGDKLFFAIEEEENAGLTAASNISSWSNVVIKGIGTNKSATPPVVTNYPAAINASMVNEGVKLVCQRENFIDKIKGYNIYKGIKPSVIDPKPINSTPVENGEYTDSAVKEKTTYYYTCRIVYDDGRISGPSKAVPITAGKVTVSNTNNNDRQSLEETKSINLLSPQGTIYKYRVNKDYGLKIKTANPPSKFPYSIEIYKSSENQAGMGNELEEYENLTGNSEIVYKVPETEDYNIKIYADENKRLSSPMTISLSAAPPDANENNDKWETATSLTTTKKFNFNGLNDVDWFKVKAGASGQLTFSIQNVPLKFDYNIEIYRGSQLTKANVKPVEEELSLTGNRELSYDVTPNEDYYIKIYSENEFWNPAELSIILR